MMKAVPVHGRAIPAQPIRLLGYAGRGGAFDIELTGPPAKVDITQVATSPCTRGLM